MFDSRVAAERTPGSTPYRKVVVDATDFVRSERGRALTQHFGGVRTRQKDETVANVLRRDAKRDDGRFDRAPQRIDRVVSFQLHPRRDQRVVKRDCNRFAVIDAEFRIVEFNPRRLAIILVERKRPKRGVVPNAQPPPINGIARFIFRFRFALLDVDLDAPRDRRFAGFVFFVVGVPDDFRQRANGDAVGA